MAILNLAKLINPVFDEVLYTLKSHIVLKGGRASTKSSVVSIDLVNDFINDPNGNVVVLRKVGKYLRMSVYEQIRWAIYEMGLANQFKFGKSPLQITHKQTGTAFYFYGVDDPMKLKSQKIAKGYVMAVWFEELAEFAGREDIDIVEDTFIRQELPNGKEVKVYFTYNPPRNPYDWINEWVAEKASDPTYMIHHSTYLDDKSGTAKIKVKNTSHGDVTLTFSGITPSAESGFIRSYVALWAAEDGGIGYGVFISAGAGEANGGGGVDGQGGGGASGAYRNDRQGWVKMVTVGVETDASDVSEVTINDVDSNQVINVSNLDGAKITTGANITQSGNSFTANDNAESQSTSGVLDSNGIGWSFEKGQKINFTFIHSNTSDTSYSIVGGVFGRASQKEVKEKPISIEEYKEPKYTPKPIVTIKPYVPVPQEKQVEVEYHKAYVKEKPVIPEKPEEPGKPKQSLPNTGTAASMLPTWGIILGLLSLAGLRKHKK